MIRSLFPQVAFLCAVLSCRLILAESAPVFAGVDANYSIGMEKDGRKWLWNGKADDLFKGMAARGVQGLRVRLWTKDEGQNGKLYATEVVKRALAAGLEPYLVIFLSEDWADLMKQPAPAIWKDLDLPKRAEAVRDYSRGIVADFRKQGLRSHLYEIGNEIDYGICGVYPGKSTKKDPEGLSRECWPQAAELIRSSQRGVLEADPNAKFLLHISHWWDANFCIAFFEFMLAHDVRVDYAGISYFPTSNIGGSIEMEQFAGVARRLHAAIKRPIIVPETGYPGTSDFKGQFSRWKKETPGYPLSPDGQRRWLGDFLDFCAHEPAIDSVYYWSPEWCGEGMWKAFALFDPAGGSKPAWEAFQAPREGRARPKRPVYFEAAGENLHFVPVDKARAEAAPLLARKLEQYGRVNVDYIKDITATDLVVDGYRVGLRGSLSGNLDLTLQKDAKPQPDGTALLDKIDPGQERVIVFSRNAGDSSLRKLESDAQARGLELVIHPLAEDSPLKFGLAGDGRGDAAY